ncbi:MAG: ABC transporter permease [Paracoccaceae bacterium]|nr:MAG: ABC transporter permease [Alphaproteobacteria bacterium]GIX12194.1 MAG: ABC transporter permease [Paracoccaceae bacterium]
MGLFLLRRLLTLIATLVAVSIVVFLVMNALPGDPALIVLGIDSTPEAQAALREKMGLNEPLALRYLHWAGAALTGDFGISHSFDVPVGRLIAERLPLTLPLAALATVATVTTAIALGVHAAARHGRLADWGVMALSQLGIAVPAFWLAILLVILFAVRLRWLPPGGFPGWDDPVAALRALVLPTVSLALVQSAILARVTRSSVLEVMRLDYARTARAKGLSRSAILRRHVLPNALIPIVTIIGMQIANLVTGTIVIENVFYLPGLGRLIFQSIANRDIFTVQALVMLFAAVVVVTNFLVDVAYALIDPRLKDRV